jgi:hypothetical protein
VGIERPDTSAVQISHAYMCLHLHQGCIQFVAQPGVRTSSFGGAVVGIRDHPCAMTVCRGWLVRIFVTEPDCAHLPLWLLL